MVSEVRTFMEEGIMNPQQTVTTDNEHARRKKTEVYNSWIWVFNPAFILPNKIKDYKLSEIHLTYPKIWKQANIQHKT